ncbi:CYTH domain-containing protein [candidate division KSB1 bacterium]|nr:CYTH domain-containing protein [candidate division KSB1 bacterium]
MQMEAVTAKIEREIKLLIRSDHPQFVADQIAALPALADFRLVPAGRRVLHDIYFGVSDSASTVERMALRVRRIDREWWLTLKGPSQPDDAGAMNRLEIEAPWSQTALQRVLEELDRRNLFSADINSVPLSMAPEKVMQQLGLRVIQRRETERRLRNIFWAANDDSPLFAELAIDHVTYLLKQHRIAHYEIEIEAKSDAADSAIAVFAECMLDRFGTALQTLNIGKLAIGRAIQQLLEAGLYAEITDSTQTLKPSAYDTIERLILQRQNDL